jgi:hypothetical protein
MVHRHMDDDVGTRLEHGTLEAVAVAHIADDRAKPVCPVKKRAYLPELLRPAQSIQNFNTKFPSIALFGHAGMKIFARQEGIE